MTKGGTGDVLSALVASLMCKNNLLNSAKAAAYLNGKAADKIYKKQKTFYNADDLLEQLIKDLSKI